MFLYFFNYDKWFNMYEKNCSLKTIEEWNSEVNVKIPLGVLYLTMGIIAELIYIPFLFALLQPDIIKTSCYKIMFMIGLIDMISIPVDAIIPGIQIILGEHFCVRPVAYYIIGAIAEGTYHAVTMACIILALDRFHMYLFPNLAKTFFGGKKIYFWLIVPIIYTLIFWTFDTPAVFSIIYHTYNCDPYLGTEGLERNKNFYHHPILITNSVLTIFLMVPLYVVLCVIVYLKPKNIPTITKLQKIMLMQSLAICIEISVVATAYVANQWVAVPGFVSIFEHICLICTHGDTPIVYLLLNAKLRKKFFELVKSYLLKGTRDRKNALQRFYATSVYPAAFQNQIHNANNIVQ